MGGKGLLVSAADWLPPDRTKSVSSSSQFFAFHAVQVEDDRPDKTEGKIKRQLGLDVAHVDIDVDVDEAFFGEETRQR